MAMSGIDPYNPLESSDRTRIIYILNKYIVLRSVNQRMLHLFEVYIILVRSLGSSGF